MLPRFYLLRLVTDICIGAKENITLTPPIVVVVVVVAFTQLSIEGLLVLAENQSLQSELLPHF